MLSENGLQQRHARCWACSRHPSAAAQHSFDVRTALHGSVLSASRQASRRLYKSLCLTFNGNLGQRKGLALPLRPTAVPPDRSAPPSRPAGKFCDGLPLALARCNTTDAHLWLDDVGPRSPYQIAAQGTPCPVPGFGMASWLQEARAQRVPPTSYTREVTDLLRFCPNYSCN